MITITCDECKATVTSVNYETMQIPVHIVDTVNGTVSGYADGDMNPVSGRSEDYELCRPCYNRAWYALAQALPTAVVAR